MGGMGMGSGMGTAMVLGLVLVFLIGLALLVLIIMASVWLLRDLGRAAARRDQDANTVRSSGP